MDDAFDQYRKRHHYIEGASSVFVCTCWEMLTSGRDTANKLLGRLLPKSFQWVTGENLRMMEKTAKND